MEEPLKDVYFTCLKCGIGTASYTIIKAHKCPLKMMLGLENHLLPQINEKLDLLLSKLDLPSVATDTKSPSKKSNFKTLKGLTELREEDFVEINTELTPPIKEAEEIKTIISDLFLTLFSKNGKLNMKTVANILSNRMKLLSISTVSDYISYTQECQDKLEKTLLEHEYKGTRLANILSKGLSALEMRFLGNKNGIHAQLEIDEVESFRQCFLNIQKYNTELKAFDQPSFIKQLLNYGLAIFPVSVLLEYTITNRNVVYIPIEKSTEEDPYSFYFLETISKDIRKWKMDCRLEELSQALINNLKPFMISLFRNIYLSIFHDNIYRDDIFIVDIPIFKQDGIQLLKNIFQLYCVSTVSSYLRNLVKEKFTYKPTVKDKINLYKDDLLQKKRLQKSGDVVDTIKLLFDNITSEEALEFYRKV